MGAHERPAVCELCGTMPHREGCPERVRAVLLDAVRKYRAGNGVHLIDPRDARDLRPHVLDAAGRLIVLPAVFWASTSAVERALLGGRTGLYSFPTVELVEHLRTIIDGRSAIEIGAGHGVLAEALGIPGTDSYQQREPKYRAYYEAIGAAVVPYGPNVQQMDASSAVRHYKPEVVIGCWVTHKYDPRKHARGGNEVGIDELDILRHCAAYVSIGHEAVHKDKPIWDRKHAIEYPPFMASRALSEGRDFVAVFDGSGAI